MANEVALARVPGTCPSGVGRRRYFVLALFPTRLSHGCNRAISWFLDGAVLVGAYCVGSKRGLLDEADDSGTSRTVVGVHAEPDHSTVARGERKIDAQRPLTARAADDVEGRVGGCGAAGGNRADAIIAFAVSRRGTGRDRSGTGGTRSLRLQLEK